VLGMERHVAAHVRLGVGGEVHELGARQDDALVAPAVQHPLPAERDGVDARERARQAARDGRDRASVVGPLPRRWHGERQVLRRVSLAGCWGQY